MTPISKTLEELIRDIYQDDHVTVVEYRTLRDDADRRMDAVVREFGLHNNMTTFQKAMDVAMQLLQSAVIDAKKGKLSDTGEAVVKDAVTAQVRYLQAGSELALRLL
jgi:predicted transcriptional regulator